MRFLLTVFVVFLNFCVVQAGVELDFKNKGAETLNGTSIDLSQQSPKSTFSYDNALVHKIVSDAVWQGAIIGFKVKNISKGALLKLNAKLSSTLKYKLFMGVGSKWFKNVNGTSNAFYDAHGLQNIDTSFRVPSDLPENAEVSFYFQQQKLGDQGQLRIESLVLDAENFDIVGHEAVAAVDPRFAAVKAKYRDYDVTHFSSNATADYVYVESARLNAQKAAMNAFFEANPDKTLIIDFKKGDGFVDDEGTATFQSKQLPKNVRKLIITNVTEDITTIGDNFLYWCKGLTELTLTFPQLTTIGNHFLSLCEGLTKLTLTFPQLTTIGDNFLHGCVGLQKLDLSFPQLTTIGVKFLRFCSKLQNLILDFPQLTTIGNNFLSYCPLLANIEGLDGALMGRLDEASRQNIVKPLRESNFPAIQQLGADLYMRYVYKTDPRVEAALAPWNLERLKVITPKSLEDIPDMKKDDVLTIFDTVMMRVKSYLDTDIAGNYERHLRPILRFLFGEDVRITWKMYADNKAEMAITMKHMAKHLNVLIQTDRGTEEATSYMSYLLDGFVHCQTRQASELNRIGILMGIMPMTAETGNLKDIYEMVNAFKLKQFETYAYTDEAVKNGAVHAYARYFTVINSKIGLPVAMQSFKERMSEITDGEADNMLAAFFTDFFTPDLLAIYIVKEIQKTKNTFLNRKGLTFSGFIHNFMAENEDEHWENEFYEGLGDDDNGIKRMNASVTEDEVKRLLKLIDVLKKENTPPGVMLMEG